MSTTVQAIPIAGVAYPSIYVKDLDAATAYYEGLFGPAAYREESMTGIRLGDTWLTIFDARTAGMGDGGTRNVEFAIRLSEPAGVDALHARIVASGGASVRPPADTWMYEPMRYACVDDALGLRLSLYCRREA